MRLPLPTRRPPSTIQRVIGKRRARQLRHRVGLVALSTGVMLLRPKSLRMPLIVGVFVGVVTVMATGMITVFK